jgi:hypothetical protein
MCFFAFGCIVRAAAFGANKRFVAVRFGVVILLTSPALDDVDFIGVGRFCFHYSVL